MGARLPQAAVEVGVETHLARAGVVDMPSGGLEMCFRFVYLGCAGTPTNGVGEGRSSTEWLSPCPQCSLVTTSSS